MMREHPSLHQLLVRSLLAACSRARRRPGERDRPSRAPTTRRARELVEQPKKWDGKTIDVRRRGDRRGDGARRRTRGSTSTTTPTMLKNVEEGAPLGGYNSGHAVWLPTELAEKITHFRRLHARGRRRTRARHVQRGVRASTAATWTFTRPSLEVVDRRGTSVHEPVKP